MEYAIILVLAILAVLFTIIFLEGKSRQAFNVVGNTTGTFGQIE